MDTVDIGAGSGKTSTLIRSLTTRLDAMEVFEPYVKEFGLKEKYDFVHVCDVLKFDEFIAFDFAVIGDTLEHLSYYDAVRLMSELRMAGCWVFVQVPFQYVQGEVNGNVHEAHLQSDLTREVMRERYPSLVEIHADERLGCYYQMP
jgi:hypothetical protein